MPLLPPQRDPKKFKELSAPKLAGKKRTGQDIELSELYESPQSKRQKKCGDSILGS